MKKLLFCTLVTVKLLAQSETDCEAVVESEPVGCSISNILNNPTPISINTEAVVKEEAIAITEKLDFIEVRHESQNLLIKRESRGEKNACPPFCIEPMNIQDVQTVGELETLAFIDKLKEKQAQLLIDTRESKVYRSGTIPGAINLPFSMLEDGSRYQEEVLKLLGAQRSEEGSKYQWSFKKAQSLLIFGTSASSNEASKSVKKLLEFGYPSAKLLYYRGGIDAWEALGLTII